MQVPDHFDRYEAEEAPELKGPRCKHCGSADVKWRIADGGGWRLFDLKRQHPGNRMVPHLCGDVADDFEDVS